ncbi:MAG TPA: hypothetical protein VIU45_03405, partial [Chitinophagaceae bacterium]
MLMHIQRLFVLGGMILVLTGLACCHTDHSSASVPAHDTTQADTLPVEVLMDTVEHATFQYFWDGAEPNSGMAP